MYKNPSPCRVSNAFRDSAPAATPESANGPRGRQDYVPDADTAAIGHRDFPGLLVCSPGDEVRKGSRAIQASVHPNTDEDERGLDVLVRSAL